MKKDKKKITFQVSLKISLSRTSRGHLHGGKSESQIRENWAQFKRGEISGDEGMRRGFEERRGLRGGVGMGVSEGAVVELSG